MTLNISFHVGKETVVEVSRDNHKGEPVIRFRDPNRPTPDVVCFFDEESFNAFRRQVVSFGNPSPPADLSESPS